MTAYDEPFTVTSVAVDAYRYEVTIVFNDEQEERTLTFLSGVARSRDRMLDMLAEYLAQVDAQPVEAKLVRVGKVLLLSPARVAPMVKPDLDDYGGFQR